MLPLTIPVGDLCRGFTKLARPSAHTLHSNLIPQQIVQMALCDLSHTFHKQVSNVSQHVFVILLWGILMSPLLRLEKIAILQNSATAKAHLEIIEYECFRGSSSVAK